MTEKLKIVGALGEEALLLPALVNDALDANNRAKYFFSLLQSARARADHLERPFSSLREERLASCVDHSELDQVVGASRRSPEGLYLIPHSEEIVEYTVAAIREMIALLEAVADGEIATGYLERFRVLSGTAAADDDLIEGSCIDAMTRADRHHGDSLHLLVMDLHKELNVLQAALATEAVEGAMTYGLEADDRLLVAAFMQGVNRTAPLKFDHPGLGTTAARSGGVVVIQNDIGTTDAHVLVIRVDGLTVTTLYSDVHLQRLTFFESLFARWKVRWEDIVSRQDGAMEDGLYHLAVARFQARDRATLESFLAFLGSRLVFLIDWNKARKRLRSVLGKAEAADLLKWAADEDVGHMGFLKCGGDELIYRGLALAAKGEHRPGLFLHDLLPRNLARQFMQFVFRTASVGLREGKQILLIEDEVVVELSRFFRGAEERLLDMAADHAALIWEVASGLRDTLLRARLPDWSRHFAHNAERAKVWESRADELVQAARVAMRRSDAAAFVSQLIEAADEVADCLEDAAFRLTTLPADGRGDLCRQLEALSRLVVAATQEYVKVVAIARLGRETAPREDMQDLLSGIYRIVALEHECDDAQRAAEAALVAKAGSFRELYVLSETAKNLEQAADELMSVALRFRDHALSDVAAH
jgi:uncharacterized protein Yka (UPF0111/DUF47 family)